MPPKQVIEKSLVRAFARTTVILAITLIAYLPVLRAQFIWDDDAYVTENANLRTLEGLGDTWVRPHTLPQYYPLVHTSFWIEYQVAGLDPVVYHANNVLLHALNAILLWRLLLLLEVPGAFLAACLFAVHPINVESVAWVTERKNVLSGVFYLASALAYWRWNTQEQAKPWRVGYVVALMLFLCALLSKTVTCSLPAALLLILWWKNGRVTRRELLSLIPMFILGGVFAFVTAHLEVSHVLARGKEWAYSLNERLLIASRAIWFYVAKLLIPTNLIFVYPKWTIDAHDPRQYVWLIVVLLVVLALFVLRDRIGRGAIAGVLIFLGTLTPALGFFNIYPMRYTFVADHYIYHASAAFFALFTATLILLVRRFTTRTIAEAIVPIVVLLPLCVLTFQRTRMYGDALTLWRDTLAKNPDSWMVHLNLAKALVVADREADAQLHFERAVVLGPDIAEAHYNLGVNLARRRKFMDALEEYDRAIALDGTIAAAYYGRSKVFLENGSLQAARAALEKAVAANPRFAEAYLNLGLVLEKQGDLKGAMDKYQAALAMRPTYAQAHMNLAHVLFLLGRIDESRAHSNQAIRLDPTLAR